MGKGHEFNLKTPENAKTRGLGMIQTGYKDFCIGTLNQNHDSVLNHPRMWEKAVNQGWNLEE
jgi:hypothetical protein